MSEQAEYVRLVVSEYLDPVGVGDESRCDRCGESLGGEPRAEVGYDGIPAVVHAEPCAMELMDMGWEIA